MRLSRKSFFKCIGVAVCSLIAFVTTISAAEFKPLSHDEALKLLEQMGYKNVRVGAVVNGLGALGGTGVSGTNTAWVVATGSMNGEVLKLESAMFFDNEIGWFHYQYGTSKNLRIWTAQDYKSFDAPASTASAPATSGSVDAAIEAIKKERMAVRARTCASNLRIIDSATQQWALEKKKSTSDTPTESDLLPYLPNHEMPTCPDSGKYKLNKVSGEPTCSIPGHKM